MVTGVPRLLSPKLERVVQIGTAATTTIALYEKVRKAQGKYRQRQWYVVNIADTEPIWLDLQERILDLIPSEDQRSLGVVYQRGHHDNPVAITYRGSRTHKVRIAGHTIRVTVLTGDGNDEVKDEGTIFDESPEAARSQTTSRTRYSLQFDCATPVARDAVIAWIGETAEARRSRQNPPEFHIATRWGGWETMPPTARREPGTVILKGTMMDDLLDDVAQFLAAREWYEDRGIPWHRGILLEGPPRTGKSSIARALATHFNLDLWYMPLGDISGDANLLQLISNIRTGGILLVEDADVFNAAKHRDQPPGERATLSGVLNTLDGVATPPGLIKVLTSNHAENLDQAVLERCDVTKHIGHIDDDQLRRIFTLMYGADHDQTIASVEGAAISVSAIVECCKRHPYTSGAPAAADAINSLVSVTRIAEATPQPPPVDPVKQWSH